MRHLLPRVIWVALLSSALLTSAKVESWTDTQGNAFKGEPSEILGPLALFRTSANGGRRLPWRALSPADCVRFHDAVAKKPARADDWAKATGALTFDLLNRAKSRQNKELVKANLAGRPEPLILVALYVDNSESKSWDLLGKSASPFQELTQKYPGQIEGIQLGLNHSKDEHQNMALSMNVPWLLVDFYEQGKVQLIKDFSPPKGEFSIIAFSRNGVPIFSANNPSETDIQKFFVDLGVLLELQRPANQRSWSDRAHYLTALQPVLHRDDATGPLLLGDPIVPKGLKDRKIYRVEARIDVAADGTVTKAVVKEDASLSPDIAAALSGALQKAAIFVPAVDHGKLVAGSYDYVLEIPH